MQEFKVSYTKGFERQIDREYKQKQFFKTLYEPIMEYGDKNKIGNNLKNNEQIVICFKSEKGMTQKSFNNIDDIILYLRGNKQLQYCETYFNLHTSTTGNRKTEDLQTCIAIGLDYDKKDFPEGVDIIDYVQGQFKKFHLFYNIVVDTSHGYHFYILLEPTTNIELVTEVTKQIAELTGADTKACKPTQLLRIPYTYNNKKLSEGKRELVKLVNIDSKYQRKNINSIANRIFKYTNNNKKKSNKTFKGTSCKRIEQLTTIPCTNRHEELLWLYGKLLQLGNTEAQIQIILEQFQELNQLEDFEYQVNYLKNYKAYAGCSGCKYHKECKQYVESDFEYKEGEKLIQTNEKILSKCKKKGACKMNGNEIVIYGILNLFNGKALSKEELLEEITFKNKKKEVINKAMSERTLKETLKNMEEKKILIANTVNRKKYYKISNKRIPQELQLEIRASVVYDVVKGYLTQEELQFYCFLRYLQHEQRRLQPSIGGNKFIMTQEEISKKYGVTRKCVNELIQELDRKFYIRIEKTNSNNNGWDYNTYYLVH